jgi:flagella basal body P-ring formation protein FlgA
MMFRRKNAIGGAPTLLRQTFLAAGLIAGLTAGLVAAPGSPAFADMGSAVVPTQLIMPGEVITASRLQEVEVTNPSLRGGYLQSIAEVDGLVATRTLLPGRTITSASLRQPYAVTRGKPVRLTFSIGSMVISAAGTPLDNASVGDVIRARNTDSGLTVSGTVMDDGSIQVMTK